MRPFGYVSIALTAFIAAFAVVRWQYAISWWWLIAAIVLYVHVLVLGAIRIRWNFFIRSFHHNPSAGRQIALTFDDGPAALTNEILDILKKEKVPAAFFSIGKNVLKQPETVKRWHDEGHLTGNHSFSHGFHFDWKSAAAMTAELEQTNAVIEEITGKKPLLFRPPYGVTNPNLARAVRRTGMCSIGWSLRSFDTAAKDPARLLARILSRLKDGDVILLHDSMAITHEILTPLIHAAREKGFTFVRPDKLLGITAYA